MKICFVTARLFDSPGSGGEVCSARLMGELTAAGHELHCLGRGSDRRGSHSLGPLVQPFDTLSAGQRALCMLGALARGQASTVQRLAAGGARQKALAGLAQGPSPDVMVVDHLQAWSWVAGLQGSFPAPLLVMHNLESDGYAERAAQLAGPGQALRRAVLQREARLLRRLEAQALRAASVVACLSADDARQLRRQADACGARVPIEVLPGYPLQPPAPLRRAPAGHRRIGMLGTWTWGPNRHGLDWVLQRVLPLLPAHCTLVLAGAGLEPARLPPRVQALGRVEHLQDFYDAVDVLALASLGGSGVQEKAIEAMASGLPIVATPHALRGLGPPWPAPVQVADEAAAFARLCTHDAVHEGPDVQRWVTGRRQAYREALHRCLEAASAAPRARTSLPLADPRCSA